MVVRIVSRESVRWGLEANDEELDILVEDFDSRIFFELKDREFGLGDSYPFVYRLTRYGGVVGVIATMEKVSADAQNFFKEEAGRRGYPIEILQFEGTQAIEKGVTTLIERMSVSQMRRLLRPFSDRVGFDFWPVVQSWIQTRMTGKTIGSHAG